MTCEVYPGLRITAQNREQLRRAAQNLPRQSGYSGCRQAADAVQLWRHLRYKGRNMPLHADFRHVLLQHNLVAGDASSHNARMRENALIAVIFGQSTDELPTTDINKKQSSGTR
jgi:hypothetical protein